VYTKVKALSIAAVLTVIMAASIAVAQLSGQPSTAVTGDFRNASVAEVQDAQGLVLLRGSFAPADSDDQGEIERVAPLTPASGQSQASGEAEVEYQTDAPGEQEVEFTVNGLTEGSEVSLVIDGHRVAVAKADRRGRVSVEIAVKTGP
jgi:hypothetical protein